MATRYWVEVSGDLNGNWNSGTSHWSATSGGSGGASTPTSTDDVIFDQPGTYTVNQVTAFNLYGINCRDLTVETGTISFTLSGGYNLPLNLYGSLYVPGDAVWTMPIVFSATSSKTIDMACTTSAYVKFYGVGGIWVLLGDLTTTGTAELYQGTLNLGGYYLTCNKFESNNAQVRSIIFGYANIIINVVDTNSGISMHQINNFTYTGEGGFYITELIDSPAITINGYSPTYSNAPNLKFTTGASVPTITSLWVSNLDFGTTSFDYGVGNASVSGLTLSSSGTYTGLGVTTTRTGTIISNGKTIASFRIGGTVTYEPGLIITLEDALTTTGTTTFDAGTLNLYGSVLTANTFSSNNTTTRTIAFGNYGTSNIITNNLLMAIATGFSSTGTSGGFVVPDTDLVPGHTFTFGTTGGTSANAPNLTFTSGANSASPTTGSYFNSLDFGTTSFTTTARTLNINNITLSSSGTYTALDLNIRGTGTLTYNGKTTGNVTLSAGTPTFADTVTCASFAVNTSVTFIYNGGLAAIPSFTQATGSTVTFNVSYALTTTGTYSHTSGALILADGVTLSTGIYTAGGNSSIQFGTASAGNINLTHTTAATFVVSITSVTTSSFSGPGGFTCTDMSVARQFLCGYTSGSTSATLPNLTFSTGSATITITATSYFNNIDFGTVSSTVSGGVGVIGNATLSSSATYTGLVMTFLLPASSSQTLTTNGKTINALTVQPTTVSPSYTGKVTFAGAVTMTNAFTFSGGTIVAPYNISCLNFAMPNASLGSPYTRIFRGSNTNLTLTGNSVSSVAVFSNTPATGLTMTNINIRTTSSAIKTFAGGNATYPVLINAGAGNLTISGNNTFDTITNSVQPTTFRFTANTTQTVTNFNVAGISGSLVTINSTSSPNPATLSKSSGFVNGGFLSIQDSTVTGGATWYAGPTSTNTSNNTGWIFTRLPVVTITNLSMSNITISDDPIPS